MVSSLILTWTGGRGMGFVMRHLLSIQIMSDTFLHPITVKAIEKPEEMPMLHMLPVDNPCIVIEDALHTSQNPILINEAPTLPEGARLKRMYSEP